MIRFLGIYREPICSPGRHRENDTVILELVADALEASVTLFVQKADHDPRDIVDMIARHFQTK